VALPLSCIVWDMKGVVKNSCDRDSGSSFGLVKKLPIHTRFTNPDYWAKLNIVWIYEI
jgi:hypothetical protein